MVEVLEAEVISEISRILVSVVTHDGNAIE